MKAFSGLLKKNIAKMFHRPLYRIVLVLLGLPVHIITFFIYQAKKKNNAYTVQCALAEQRIRGSEADHALRAEVDKQLKNKLAFLSESYSPDRFQREADRVYRERFQEMVAEDMLKNCGPDAPKPVTYVNTLAGLLDSVPFLLLTVLLGWPMVILVVLYANAYSKYIFERIVMMVFVIFGVTFLVFTILYLSPLDAATNILGPTATQEQIVSFNQTYGLDQPFLTQLLGKFKSLITFDLGKSYTGNEDVAYALMRKFPITLELTFYSLLLALVIAIPAGIISAVRSNTISDYTFMLLALLGLSIPNFWLGLILIYNFAIKSNIFPATFFAGNWKSLVMPAIVLGTSLAATVTRMTRSSMLEVVNQDYIVTAKAKGVTRGKVILRHALPNAMIPIVTVVGLQFGGMLGGSAVTEKVFNVNGIGKYIVDKQFVPDIPVVLAGVVYIAIVISFVNLFVDILYTLLDPRIKSKLKNY